MNCVLRPVSLRGATAKQKCTCESAASEIGARVSFDSAYDGVTAVEQLLGAFGADLVCGLLARAKKRRIEIDSAEASSSKVE